MIFEVGKCYKSKKEGGAPFCVIGEVNSIKWGKVLVMEDSAFPYALSCVEKEAVDINDRSDFFEIKQKEWDENFIKSSRCFECGNPIETGQPYRPTKRGFIHEGCFQKFIAEEDD